MTPDPAAFLERFFAFGADPSVATYLPLFHPDATLFDAGMERPITVAEIPEHLEATLKLVPDLRMTPERWRLGDRTLFVEARNQATVGRTPARWRSVYCVDLEGDRVVRGRRYYDRQPLYALLNAALPALPPHPPVASEVPPVTDPYPDVGSLIRAFGDAWVDGGARALTLLFREDGSFCGPDLPRPLSRQELPHYHAALTGLLGGFRLNLLSSAGDDALAFAEWRLTADLGGEPVTLNVVDRFDLAGGLVLAARAYFDTLELAARLAAHT